MTRKTERIYGAAQLDGSDRMSVDHSLKTATRRLELNAERDHREVLWDTLEIELETETYRERTITASFSQIVEVRTQVKVSALAVFGG